MLTTEQIIRAAVNSLSAPRGKSFISTPHGSMRVNTDGEKVITLPNGVQVRVHTDASGTVTHIEENDHLHAIVRPQPCMMKFGVKNPEIRQ